MNNNYAAIMAGSMASRFWPASRTNYPKQFLDILGVGQTLIQQTFKRIEKIIPKEHIYVIVPTEYIGLVETQLPTIPKKNILGEPERKNAAISIAYVSFKLSKENGDGSLIIAPADHLVSDDEAFATASKLGLDFVHNREALIVLGIKPTHANIEYEYVRIQRDEPNAAVYKIKEFIENPERDLAMKCIADDSCLWNSGIYISKINNILKGLQKFFPEVYHIFNGELAALNTLFENSAIKSIYETSLDIYTDFSFLKKATDVFVIEAAFVWSDLSTWKNAWENMNKDGNKNAVTGKNVMMIDSNNCIVHSSGEKLIVLQGLNDYIIIDTNDVLLICEKKNEQRIKEFIQEVKNKKGEQYLYTPAH